MDWARKARALCIGVANTTLDFTVSTLSTCGAGAIAIGAAGLAFAQGLNEQYNTAYSVKVDVTGDLNISGSLANETSSFANLTVPVHLLEEHENHSMFELSSYVNQKNVRTISFILLVSGSAIKLLADSLKSRREYGTDKQKYLTHHKIELDRPSSKERLFIYAESICASLTLAFLSNAMTHIIIYTSKTLSSNGGLTYPPTGDNMNGTYYSGPVTTTSVPVHIAFDPTQLQFPFPGLGKNISMILDMVADGIANVTAGAGINPVSQEHSAVAPMTTAAILVVAAAGTNQAHSFFSKKRRLSRDERVMHYCDQQHSDEQGSLLDNQQPRLTTQYSSINV